MNQEEINKRNVAIAEYMGWVLDYSGIRWAVPADGIVTPIGKNYSSGTRLETKNLRFHEDWKWIMAVVEKIESLDNYIDITRHYCQSITDGNPTETYKVTGSKIQSVFMAVSDYCLKSIKPQ